MLKSALNFSLRFFLCIFALLKDDKLVGSLVGVLNNKSDFNIIAEKLNIGNSASEQEIAKLRQ